MTKIRVIILNTISNADIVEKIFDGSSFYDVKIVPCGRIETANEETNVVMKCLRDNVDADYVLLIKDTSVTNSTPDYIENIIQYNIEKSNFDILYLCKWLDRCDLYTNREIIMGTTTVVKTQAPRGIQAILIKQEGLQKIIGITELKDGSFFKVKNDKSLSESLIEEISRGNIDANAVVPNLFSYDISKCNKQSDFLKSMECVLPPNEDLTLSVNQKNGYKFSSYVLLVVLLVLIGIGIYFLVYSRSRPIQIKKESCSVRPGCPVGVRVESPVCDVSSVCSRCPVILK